METYLRHRPPAWFTVVAILLIVWGLMGCASFYAQEIMDPPMGDEWDRAFLARMPAWLTWAFAASVGGGLLGSIALLLRSRFAKPLYIVSLVAVIVQFGYVFLATDLLAHKGAAATVPFPLFIAAVAVAQIWIASFAEKRGWLS